MTTKEKAISTPEEFKIWKDYVTYLWNKQKDSTLVFKWHEISYYYYF